MSRCQECNSMDTVYNEDTMSSALCPPCILDRLQEEDLVYDYPNEREDTI